MLLVTTNGGSPSDAGPGLVRGLSPDLVIFIPKYLNPNCSINPISLLNEVISDRVDYLITEDKKIHTKALESGISERVHNIDSFLEKLISENITKTEVNEPTLIEYRGNIPQKHIDEKGIGFDVFIQKSFI